MARSKTRQRQRQKKGRSTSQLRQRVTSALANRAYQRAREDAKTLYKEEPTAEHRRYLVEATIGRAAQMRQAGQSTEALKLLATMVAEASETPEQIEPYINELLHVGNWQTADRLIGQVTDASLQGQLAALRIDHAVLCDEVEQVPDSLAPFAQGVKQALAAWEQGHDTAADDAVADLAGDSPWHDWHVLIRGLTTYDRDPSAAVAWWRELDPNRAPSAIAAPFWGQIDKAFLNRHPQSSIVTARGRQLYDAPCITALECLQQALLESDITTALHHAKTASPELSEALRDRLSRMLYWQVARLGDEDDIQRFSKTFGAPADDPSLNRLQAVMDEQDPFFLDESQAAWAKYEQDLVQRDIIAPETDRDLARALLWIHMGQIAEKESPTPPGGFDSTQKREYGCEIDTLQCLRRAVELAPQYLTAHETLISLLTLIGDQAEVIGAAHALLAQFPDHDMALSIVADEAFREGRWEDAAELQKRALRLRPHEVSFQERLRTYQLAVSRLRAQQGQFDEAREILTSYAEQVDANSLTNLLCRRAAVELKAGQPKEGERLFEEACEVGAIRLVTVFQMLIESVRMPVDDKWIKKMEREFRRGLKAKVHGPSVVEMIKILYGFAMLGTHYDALEEHQELVLQYLKRSRQVRFSEDEFITLCQCLPKLTEDSLGLDIIKRARRSYPEQPIFHVTFATYYLNQPQEMWPLEDVDDALHEAEYLVQGDPDERELAQSIDALLNVVHAAMEQHRRESYFNPFDDDDDFDSGPAGPSVIDLFEKLADLLGGVPDDDDDRDDVFPFPPPSRKKKAKRRRR